MEPSANMLQEAERLHSDSNVKWLMDSLPELACVNSNGFDLIMVSAVWHHLTTEQQKESIIALKSLLDSNGRLIISLRNGAPAPDRIAYEVFAFELTAMATEHGLQIYRAFTESDSIRSEISWTVVELGSRTSAT